MIVVARQDTQDTGVSGYLPALMSTRPPQADDGSLPWPERLRCDLIDAPLDACCGVIAHLAHADVEVCPVAQIADRLLFLVAEGSSASCSTKIEGLPEGVVLAGAVSRFPDRRNGTPVGGCWVIPPDCAGPVLPPAGLVVAALRTAYAEYRTATENEII